MSSYVETQSYEKGYEDHFGIHIDYVFSIACRSVESFSKRTARLRIYFGQIQSYEVVAHEHAFVIDVA